MWPTVCQEACIKPRTWSLQGNVAYSLPGGLYKTADLVTPRKCGLQLATRPVKKPRTWSLQGNVAYSLPGGLYKTADLVTPRDAI